VGIVTQAKRGAVGPVRFVVWWTVLLPLPLLIVGILIQAFGPQTASIRHVVVLAPVSGAYAGIQATFAGTEDLYRKRTNAFPTRQFRIVGLLH
jgi:hypothetical protein